MFCTGGNHCHEKWEHSFGEKCLGQGGWSLFKPRNNKDSPFLLFLQVIGCFVLLVVGRTQIVLPIPFRPLPIESFTLDLLEPCQVDGETGPCEDNRKGVQLSHLVLLLYLQCFICKNYEEWADITSSSHISCSAFLFRKRIPLILFQKQIVLKWSTLVFFFRLQAENRLHDIHFFFPLSPFKDEILLLIYEYIQNFPTKNKKIWERQK